MNSIFILSLEDTFNKIDGQLKKFIADNYDSPLFWGGIVLVVLSICLMAYNSLHGDGK